MLKKTELYIENKQVDLYGDEAFVLNFNVADITDIAAKASSYSKELDIPATKENNKIFSHLFNVSSEGYFNPISKKTCELFVDGVCVMKGYFKLNSITIVDNEYVTYHAVIYEDSVNFIQSLGDLELSNLVMPLTGITTSPSGAMSNIIIDTPTGTDYNFTAASFMINPITGAFVSVVAARKYSVNFTNYSTSGPLYGTLQPITKNAPYAPWVGSGYTNQNVNAWVALQDVTVNLLCK